MIPTSADSRGLSPQPGVSVEEVRREIDRCLDEARDHPRFVAS